jgi:hypothetical protein
MSDKCAIVNTGQCNPGFKRCGGHWRGLLRCEPRRGTGHFTSLCPQYVSGAPQRGRVSQKLTYVSAGRLGDASLCIRHAVRLSNLSRGGVTSVLRRVGGGPWVYRSRRARSLGSDLDRCWLRLTDPERRSATGPHARRQGLKVAQAASAKHSSASIQDHLRLFSRRPCGKRGRMIIPT